MRSQSRSYVLRFTFYALLLDDQRPLHSLAALLAIVRRAVEGVCAWRRRPEQRQALLARRDGRVDVELVDLEEVPFAVAILEPQSDCLAYFYMYLGLAELEVLGGHGRQLSQHLGTDTSGGVGPRNKADRDRADHQPSHADQRSSQPARSMPIRSGMAVVLYSRADPQHNRHGGQHQDDQNRRERAAAGVG